jgi:hypothetical protein
MDQATSSICWKRWESSAVDRRLLFHTGAETISISLPFSTVSARFCEYAVVHGRAVVGILPTRSVHRFVFIYMVLFVTNAISGAFLVSLFILFLE